MCPVKTLESRAKLYSDGDYGEVYKLYSARSDFKLFFNDLESYVEHAKNIQSKESRFLSHTILKERVKGKLAEVCLVEHFLEGLEKLYVKYITRTILVYEDDQWLILREERETA